MDAFLFASATFCPALICVAVVAVNADFAAIQNGEFLVFIFVFSLDQVDLHHFGRAFIVRDFDQLWRKGCAIRAATRSH